MPQVNRTLVLVIAVIATAFGVFLGGLELYHVAHREHALDVTTMTVAALFMLVGALTIQFGDLQKALSVMTDSIPLLNAFRRRAVDNPEAPIPPRLDGSHEITATPAASPAASPVSPTVAPIILPDEQGRG